MTENGNPKATNDFSKIPIRWPILVAVLMFGAAIWGGGEIARGEIAQQQIDSITAKGRLVKILVALPKGAVVGPQMVEIVDVFANRVEPYCLTTTASVVGKKTKFSLERDQILTARDLQ